MEDRIIKGSRTKTLGYLALSILLVSASALEDGGVRIFGIWWGMLFFGLCTLVFLWTLIRPQLLKLDSEGFSTGGGLTWRSRKIRWKDTQDFFVWKPPRGAKQIGFNFEPTAESRTFGARFNSRFGAEGSLGGTSPGPIDDVVAELNAYRKNALRTSHQNVAP